MLFHFCHKFCQYICLTKAILKKLQASGMTKSFQIAYSKENGTTFDYEYYMKNHMDLLSTGMALHWESVQVTKGLSGGPDTPAPFHAITTVLYKDQAALEASMALAGPAFADVPNYYDGQPTVLIGEVLD
jgi:uncharacterized protein (TIGR02118 family)